MARIMLVDDDRELLNIASALLVHAQFDVHCCESVIEALDQIQRQEFDVVITDANMSPHSGFDLIRSVKSLPNYDLVPIAMLTGRREKRDVERALSVGAQDYIVKPLDPEHFIKKVGELAQLSETNRRNSRFAEVALNESATCELGLTMIGLTEQSILFETEHKLQVGSMLRVNSEIFQKIGVLNLQGSQGVQVRVASCTAGRIEGFFEVRVKFESMDEKNAAKIRQYLHARILQHKRTGKVA